MARWLMCLLPAVLALQVHAGPIAPASVGEFLGTCGSDKIRVNSEACVSYVSGVRVGFAVGQRGNPACADATMQRNPLTIIGVLQQLGLPDSTPIYEGLDLVLRAERNCRVAPGQRGPL